MSRFLNRATKVTFSVADDKDERYAGPGYDRLGGAPSRDAGLTKAEMLAEIERRNEGRDEDDRIVPLSQKNADLKAALAADDATAGTSGDE